ncbi:(R,R)-butanediol dehydrogenase/meso-butanediol dehydrogenase/diacetyl reductase [Nocardia bhagyanarayanae]|uniref:(R,R)-butanediol dehydrogenase/meso-butanediol dehydrogenase/diacetyl reductase n=2 Tax=Nocardia bhagyanarayanae TaxID=1215925 RepID=A0A543FHN3_9NOCA|nr:(R,R)-butanediol dehydrogenase/meso-butanediol dehydrogenase/diacetyl reductase [Nocardia bhagyanarayanae]
MQAALYHGPRDIRIEEVEIPVLATGEVLVKVLRSGICGTDAGEWIAGPKVFPVRQRHPHSGHLGPIIPGHEFVGEIVEAGPRPTLLPGTLVASGAGIWCGECRRCRQGRTNKCVRYRTLGLNVHGGMAEYVAVPSATLRPLTPEMTLDHAALAQPLAVGIHAARRAGTVAGDRVVVIGAGAIGSFVLAGLRHLGDFQIAVVDIAASRLARAKRLGADITVTASAALADELTDAFDGANPDVVIEASGAPGQLALALELVTDGGRVEAVGIPKQKPEIDLHSMIFREITLETTLAHICDTDLPAALHILAQNPLLGQEFAETPVGLAQLGESLDRLATGQVEGKILIDPTA